jgi:glycosyltransferase involved in cell wall biosynthesis
MSLPRIGYLASHYPAVSHAFVLREVEALRRCGVEVETFSIHRTPESEQLADADREAARTTYAVLPPKLGDLVGAHVTAFARHPVRYLRTLALAIRLGPPGLRGRLWQIFYFIEAMPIWREARRRDVRHLHAIFADVATDVALLVTEFGGRGWSWSLAVHGSVEFFNVRLYRLAEKIRRARFTIAISDFGRSQLMTEAEEPDWKRIHVVRCGVEPEVYIPLARRNGGAPYHLLSVGRLIHVKGHPLLMEAVAELRRRGIDTHLTLVGEGPKRAELEAIAARLNVADHVTFAGAVGQDHIRELYATADVFCMASMAEGLPVVLIEAMAMRIPVVATRITGIPELVEDGVSGLLVTPARLDELVVALERILTDEELRERLGHAGRDKVLALHDVNVSALRLREIFANELEAAR